MFTKNPFTKWITIILCFVSFTTACAGVQPPVPVDGDAYNLFYGTSRYIVQESAAFKAGTQLFEGEKLYVFARGYPQGFSFVPVDKTNLQVVNDPGVLRGNLINVKTYQAFRDWMTANGYTILKAIPAALQAFVAQTAQNFMTFYILPAGAIGENSYFNDTFLAPYEGTDQ